MVLANGVAARPLYSDLWPSWCCSQALYSDLWPSRCCSQAPVLRSVAELVL